MKKLILCAALIGFSSFAVAADAPTTAPTGIRRTELQRVTVPGTNFVTITMRTELDPGAQTGMHTHPGDEIGYVLSGQLTLKVKGQPDLTLKPGDSYRTPAGTPHNGVSSGTETYRSIATYIVDTTQPMTTPVP